MSDQEKHPAEDLGLTPSGAGPGILTVMAEESRRINHSSDQAKTNAAHRWALEIEAQRNAGEVDHV